MKRISASAARKKQAREARGQMEQFLAKRPHWGKMESDALEASLRFEGYRKKRYKKILQKAARSTTAFFPNLRGKVSKAEFEKILLSCTVILPTHTYNRLFPGTGGVLANFPYFENRETYPRIKFRIFLPEDVMRTPYARSTAMHEMVHLARRASVHFFQTFEDSEAASIGIQFFEAAKYNRKKSPPAKKPFFSRVSGIRKTLYQMTETRKQDEKRADGAELGVYAWAVGERLRTQQGERAALRYWQRVAQIKQPTRQDILEARKTAIHEEQNLKKHK